MHRGPHVKNIVICCGGTGNEISENISNVLTLYRFLRKTDETEPHQIAFYDPGVGTLPPCRPHPPRERSRSSRTWDWTLIASGEPREGRADRTFRLLICPTGKSPIWLSSPVRKNFPLPVLPKSNLYPPPSRSL
jgi:hypothetical protein